MSREKEALIETLQIYAETDEPVSQKFYQELCLIAIELLKENEEMLKWWENLTRDGNIGTKNVPSLHDYIVQLQAELERCKELLSRYHICTRCGKMLSEVEAQSVHTCYDEKA